MRVACVKDACLIHIFQIVHAGLSIINMCHMY